MCNYHRVCKIHHVIRPLYFQIKRKQIVFVAQSIVLTGQALPIGPPAITKRHVTRLTGAYCLVYTMHAADGAIWLSSYPLFHLNNQENRSHLSYTTVAQWTAMGNQPYPQSQRVCTLVYGIWDRDLISTFIFIKGFLELQNIDILFHQGLYITPRPKMSRPLTSPVRQIVFYLGISPAPRSTSRTIRHPLSGFNGSNPI